jgi:ubiquinone/menaquinone biosynthesis C-methylase UbiE
MNKLNVGCGNKILNGYTNIDLYVEHPSIIKMDVMNITLPKGTFDEVLCEDILEHIPRLQWKSVLASWCSLVKLNGQLIIQSPDMHALCNELIKAQSNDDYFEQINRRIYGGQGDGRGNGEGMFHYTGFSSNYLMRHLEKNGFKHISTKYYNFNFTLVMEKINDPNL